MMPAAKGMSHVIPNHVLRVGQTIRLDPAPDSGVGQHPGLAKPSGHHDDADLEISLENLNQLIMDLDPTFEPIQVNKSPSCISPPTDTSSSDEDTSPCRLVSRGCPPSSPLVLRGCPPSSPLVLRGCPPSSPLLSRGCSPSSSPTVVPSVSPSIPIPSNSSISCSPHGSLVFSSSPTSSLPPLPCGSAPRRNPSTKQDCSLRLSTSNRNSVISLLSTSTCSDTSYILGSNLSLAGEDADSPESILSYTPSSFSDGSRSRPFDICTSPDKPPLTRRGHVQELHGKGVHSSPASLSGSLTDIPVLLVNGAPQPDQLPEIDLIPTVPAADPRPSYSGFQACFKGSQPSMKFVMDTSKFWFRPHMSRAEAEALIKDKEAGTFVVRDSTSYRGSFGLAMKVDQSPTSSTPDAYPGESSSDLIRHFLIESSAKGVRIKGSSQEPYFGSLSALVYQHTISAYALPCRLLLHSQDLGTADEKANEKAAFEDKNKIASNFMYLNAVPTETLTGPCAVQRAVTSTLQQASTSPTIVNMKVSLKGVTLTDIKRKLFFRRHYPAHLLSFAGEDPDKRLWMKGSSFAARMFGFVAKGVEAGMENVCHVFAEYDPLQPSSQVCDVIQAAVAKP
ncbi:tensin-4 [Stegastes partitus]|uniref:Tensin-4 n=1 Tax=Stegastes partitus TaxID=144197 RepID=A0A3B4Z6W4_9TELE|nr:PREDICTED: tensin-4 [Stegastes partitus]XP_008299334.1 PREDICTED: tensin-4 [Stegastes partitus]